MSAGNIAERKQSGRFMECVKEPTRTWYRIVHSEYCSWSALSVAADPGSPTKWNYCGSTGSPHLLDLKLSVVFQDGEILLVSVKIHLSELEWFSSRPCAYSSQWSVPDFAICCTLVTVFMKQCNLEWFLFRYLDFSVSLSLQVSFHARHVMILSNFE